MEPVSRLAVPRSCHCFSGGGRLSGREVGCTGLHVQLYKHNVDCISSAFWFQIDYNFLRKEMIDSTIKASHLNIKQNNHKVCGGWLHGV